MTRVQTIAIDGPGASGKTVVGRGLARKLGYRFVDTGTMYRAVTRVALDRGVSLDDDEALAHLASSLSIDIGEEREDGSPPRLCVDGRDLTDAVRTPEVDRAVSRVSAVAGVRTALVRLQRALGEQGKVVMAGRDIGTVVLPDAGLKLFLLASEEERARRRYRELVERHVEVTFDSVLEDLRRRDRLDSERDISPLSPAEDAERIETDDYTLSEVVDRLWRLTEKP